MKRIFMRATSFLSALASLVPVVGNFPQSEILVVQATDVDEAVLDAQYDYFSTVLLASAGDWERQFL